MAWILAGLALFALGAPTLADERVALVIGNAQYKNTAALANPSNDASDVAEALTNLGFKVSLRLDADKREFDRAVEQFARAARTADAALFYYAGHGMQFQGRNYLVPVDAELRDEISVRYELTPIDDAKEALQNSSGVQILILDSCRDNPLAENLVRSLGAKWRDLPSPRGLAPIERASGMIVVYATQANEVAEDGAARNSPFSSALLRELKEPGLEVGAMFRRVQEDVFRATSGRQTPELTISRVPEYYLNQSETDRTVWARVRESGDAAALQAFIQRYPNSFFAPDATARLAALGERAHAPPLAALAELTAKLDAAEAERRRLEDELAKRQADNTAADQAESLKGEAERLKAEIAGLQQQVADARAAAESEARKADQAVKAAEQKPPPSVASTPTPAPAPTPAVAGAQPAQQKPLPSASPAAAPAPAPTPTVVAAAEVVDLPQMRAELRRIGCYAGGDADWSAPEMRVGVAKYAHYAKLDSPPAAPTVALLEDLRRRGAAFCPPQCSAREILVGSRCVAKTCARDEFLSDSGACVAKPKPRPRVAANRVSPSAIAPARRAPAGHCLVFNGNQYCE
jgi:uncharacterized caspase-like protein